MSASKNKYSGIANWPQFWTRIALVVVLVLTLFLINLPLAHADLDPGSGGGDSSGGGGASTSILGCDGPDGISCLIGLGVKILSGGVAAVAVAMMIYAGVLYASAGTNEGRVRQAKEIITNVVIGAVAYVLFAVIMNFLVPGGVF